MPSSWSGMHEAWRLGSLRSMSAVSSVVVTTVTTLRHGHIKRPSRVLYVIRPAFCDDGAMPTRIREDLRNVAIIAHVDHGKLLLLLRNSARSNGDRRGQGEAQPNSSLHKTSSLNGCHRAYPAGRGSTFMA